MRGDILSLENDKQPGETLIAPVMRAGKRIAPAPTLAQIRERAARELDRLPEPLRRLEPGVDYPVQISKLSALAAQMDAKRMVVQVRYRSSRKRDPANKTGSRLRGNKREATAVPALFQPRAPSP